MPTSTLRQQLQAGALAFLWDEWSQMGVLGSAERQSPWAQDPEALLLLTFEIAREDPRLFDEVLDWMTGNESMVSARRLRNLCDDAEDQRLVAAALDWTAGQRRRTARGRPSARSAANDTQPLFRGVSSPVRTPDPAFLAHGLLRSTATAGGKSRPPDLNRPINFAFRLRHLLGVSARAEVVRFLLTVDAPSATVAAITVSAGYAKRNVQEALTALQTAGTVARITVGPEQRYRIDRERWANLWASNPYKLPVYCDWPQLFSALRTMLRWLNRPDLADLSDYLRTSQARDLLEDVQPRLSHAGVLIPARQDSATAWDDLTEAIDAVLASLGQSRSMVTSSQHR